MLSFQQMLFHAVTVSLGKALKEKKKGKVMFNLNTIPAEILL